MTVNSPWHILRNPASIRKHLHLLCDRTQKLIGTVSAKELMTEDDNMLIETPDGNRDYFRKKHIRIKKRLPVCLPNMI